MEHSWLRDKPYNWLVQQAEFKVDELRKRGGGYVGLASVTEKFIQTHRPEKRVTGSPCQECSEPWPCAGFAMAWADD